MLFNIKLLTNPQTNVIIIVIIHNILYKKEE